MKKIISIQSHVAYGYVGNRAAVFPLQRLGFDVTAINTVQFSNHPGYGHWTGEIFTAKHINNIISGIENLGVLADFDALLSGYLGDAETGQAIINAHHAIKKLNSSLIYCCDPVLGDTECGLFVKPEIAEFFKTTALKFADILTPNQFEAEYLTGNTINSLKSAINACAQLRAAGPKIILLTSLRRSDNQNDTIEILLNTATGSWLISTPYLTFATPPKGSGDAIAALFLAYYLRHQDPVLALEQSTASIFAIFQMTHAAKSRELQLIAAQDAMVNPIIKFIAQNVL